MNEQEVQQVIVSQQAEHQQQIVQGGQMTDDEILSFTRGVRVAAVKELTRSGAVPAENGEKALLMTALKDLDSQAINKKRLVIEEKGADNSSLIVAHLLKEVNRKTAFKQVPGAPGGPVIDVAAKVLPDTIDGPVILPGEGEVNPAQMDYESFMVANGVDPANLGAAAANNPHPEADTGDDVDDDGSDDD
jgi:hypothetical protein